MSSHSSRYDRYGYGYDRDRDRHAPRTREDRDAGPSHRRPREAETSHSRGERRKDTTKQGIKTRTFGDAFLGPEQEAYVREQLRGQLASSDGADTPSSSAKAPASVTPRMVVDEIKRSGHFDQLRKQLFASFQSSPQREELTTQLQTFLMGHLENMSPEKRQRLARQDTRLQHSELERALEDTPEVAKIFDGLLGRLRDGGKPDASDDVETPVAPSTDDDNTPTNKLGKNALLAANDGALFTQLQSRVKETIDAEKRQAAETAATAESSHKQDAQQAEAAATPLVNSSSHVGTGSGSSTAEGRTQSTSGESDAGSATPQVKFSTASTPLRHEITGGP